MVGEAGPGDMATLEERLGRRIVGQRAAVKTVVDALGRAGHSDHAGVQRPRAVFLFVGPPGVGKTELARVLAEELNGSSSALIHFDMKDFTTARSTAKLVGGPPGSPEQDQRATLVAHLRTQPHAVLLFDEVEHAHEDVLDVLVRLVSEGALADGDGHAAGARDSIVIMTSNILESQDDSPIGVTHDVPPARLAAPHGFAAPLEGHSDAGVDRHGRGRDGVIVRFSPLAVADLYFVAGRRVHDVVARAGEVHAVVVDVAAEVLPWLVAKAVKEGPGARAIARTVETYLTKRLDGFLASGKGFGRVRVSVGANGLDVHAAV